MDFSMLHKSLDAFWEVYITTYLPQLREHSLKPTEAPKLNEMVIIAEESKRRNRWELGIITRLIPGKDGAIRAAEVQLLSGQGTCTRAIQKLVPVERDFWRGEDMDAPWRVDRDLNTAMKAKAPHAINGEQHEPDEQDRRN